ncbi:MAG TPA: hypothetical protein VKZ54_00240, partial [Membranihabitans sp.]|nr:hypothetical protein [Membranihabitans sp.]
IPSSLGYDWILRRIMATYFIKILAATAIPAFFTSPMTIFYCTSKPGTHTGSWAKLTRMGIGRSIQLSRVYAEGSFARPGPVFVNYFKKIC